LKKIGLISDTHGYLDEQVIEHFKSCDEIWHGGDFGSLDWVNQLKLKLEAVDNKAIIRGVYGNIDGHDIRAYFPEDLFFTCEEVNVFMKHIGGYPGRYAPGVKDLIIKNDIQLFISGHSHILKVMYDEKINCLHMNPGAAGKQGWHKTKTLIRFVIDGKDMKDCEVIELG
jgi:putative phosphoesterase